MRNAVTDRTTGPNISAASRANELALVAREAAESVGPSLKAAFRNKMEVEHKLDLHDPVTIHDRQTEQTLRAFLAARVPDSVVVGEEQGRSGEPASLSTVEWYVDPIDGTANFAGGLAFWCVSIGAVVGGEVVAGAVHDPMTGNTFWADDRGAWVNDAPIRAASRPDEARAFLITSYPSVRDFQKDGRTETLERFGRLTEAFATIRRPGSAALSLCHVAAGWCDAAVGVSVSAWDVSAAMLILRRAGGRYRPLRMKGDVPDHLCPGYLATGPDVFYPTLETVCDEIEAGRAGRFKAAVSSRTVTSF
jgi:myo-inositol-1(or 4)-monophosphatase